MRYKVVTLADKEDDLFLWINLGKNDLPIKNKKNYLYSRMMQRRFENWK